MAIGKIFSYTLNFGLFVKESNCNILQKYIIQTILWCIFAHKKAIQFEKNMRTEYIFLAYIDYFSERNVEVSKLLPIIHQSLEILEKRVLVLIKKALN